MHLPCRICAIFYKKTTSFLVFFCFVLSIVTTSPSGLCGNTRTLEGVLFMRSRSNKMADKNFKTIEEQIEILRSRGLTINDESHAKDFLLYNNYYQR